MYQWSKVQYLTITGMFAAIIFILMFLNIGILPLPFVRPTILHIPVIIGALLMGPKYGALLGFMFGLASMLFATYNPGPTSFVFSPFVNIPGQDSGSIYALIVAFVPRILVGIVPWYVYAGLRRLFKEKANFANCAVAGIAGALTNTLLVLHLIFVLFGAVWNIARPAYTPGDVAYAIIMGIIITNGIPEAIASAIIVPAVVGALVVVIDKSFPRVQKR